MRNFVFVFKVVKQRSFWQTCGLDMNAPQEDTPTPPAPVTAPGIPVPDPAVLPREIGGRGGPEPTRFGDWEKAGRCIDF
jgi:hypothetical protein